MTLTEQIINHAKQQYPSECCGLIVDGDYITCKNVADDPAETFRISRDDWQPADVVVHSHPQGQRYPSGADRQAQHKMRCDWWIAVAGTGNWEIVKYRYAPLLRGRTFEYGKRDCYSMVEDAYMLCGIELMAYKRKGEAQEIADNAFIVNFPRSGFYQVELTDMQPGDVILTSIRGNANHASIYLGDEQVLHHPYGGLSRREGFCDVWHKTMHSVWRHQNWQPAMMTAITNDLEVTR